MARVTSEIRNQKARIINRPQSITRGMHDSNMAACFLRPPQQETNGFEGSHIVPLGTNRLVVQFRIWTKDKTKTSMVPAIVTCCYKAYHDVRNNTVSYSPGKRSLVVAKDAQSPMFVGADRRAIDPIANPTLARAAIEMDQETEAVAKGTLNLQLPALPQLPAFWLGFTALPDFEMTHSLKRLALNAVAPGINHVEIPCLRSPGGVVRNIELTDRHYFLTVGETDITLPRSAIMRVKEGDETEESQLLASWMAPRRFASWDTLETELGTRDAQWLAEEVWFGAVVSIQSLNALPLELAPTAVNEAFQIFEDVRPMLGGVEPNPATAVLQKYKLKRLLSTQQLQELDPEDLYPGTKMTVEQTLETLTDEMKTRVRDSACFMEGELLTGLQYPDDPIPAGLKSSVHVWQLSGKPSAEMLTIVQAGLYINFWPAHAARFTWLRYTLNNPEKKPQKAKKQENVKA